MPIAHVNHAPLYYETAGSGSVLVFLHGFTLDTRMWDDQFSLFAQRARVLRYDLRGFGQSALPTGEAYSHVDDLSVLLDHLGVEQATLVGLSMGGAIALDFALVHPQRVQALVLIDTVLGGFPWSPESTAREGLIWQRARAGGIPAAKEAWFDHRLFVPARRKPEVAARLARIIDDYSGWHFVNANPERSPDPPAAQRLHEIQAPVLALVGGEDTPDFLEIAALIRRQVPHAAGTVVLGAGHMANMEAPEQVNEAIWQFLDRQETHSELAA